MRSKWIAFVPGKRDDEWKPGTVSHLPQSFCSWLLQGIGGGGEVGWVFYKTSIENKLSLRFKWIQPLSNSKLLYSTWATRYTKSQPTHHKTKCKPKPNLNFTPLVLTGRMCCTNMSFNRHLSIANMHQNIYQNVFLYIFGIRNLQMAFPTKIRRHAITKALAYFRGDNERSLKLPTNA